MLFVSRADIERVKDALRQARLCDSEGIWIVATPTDDQIEAVAMQALSAVPMIWMGRPEVVWPTDIMAVTPKGPIFTPPKIT